MKPKIKSQMLRFVLLLTNLLFFFSCSSSSKIKNDLNILSSSSINIPNEMTVIYNGRDTIINYVGGKLKFIVYTDSSGCTSCGINKMHLWIPLLKYSETYYGELKFYFIYHSTNANIQEICNLMMFNPINYPILMDKNGDFEKLNPHLPKNRAMHAFLLDENNKVILVGNPLYNKEIEKLFYKKTHELLSK